jgi:hypothetical protein
MLCPVTTACFLAYQTGLSTVDNGSRKTCPTPLMQDMSHALNYVMKKMRS